MIKVSGIFYGRPAALTIEDGKITEGQHSGLAATAIGICEAGGEVTIPGVWSGTANLTDPWAIRALLIDLLDPGTARFEGDEPPPLGDPGTPDTVY